MVNSINSAVAQALFGASNASDSGISADALATWAAAKAGVNSQTVADLTADRNAPAAPVWTPGYTPGAAVLIARANAGKAFFDTNAKLYSDLGATGDYKRLFALHTGISTLQALAANMEAAGITKTQQAQTQAQFSRGLGELQQFFTDQQFEDMRLAQGDRVDSAQTSLAIATKSEDYTTGIIHKGSLSTTVSGLDSNAKFDVVATSAAGTERTVSIDLSQMGSIPRSLGAVISFINNKLSAAGVASRLEALDQTPKTSTIVIGGQVSEVRYVGSKQYALKVDVRAGEKVGFQPVAADPAFYLVGANASGARLIKLADVDGAPGQPDFLTRPEATSDPIGALVAGGWYGAGEPYTSAPAGAQEARTNALVSAGPNNFDTALHGAGEAVLKLAFDDGRTISVSTAWRSDDLEAWRQRSGESRDQAILDDLAERLTQLLHEQGVAAGVGVWQNGGDGGFSIFSADGVKASSFTVSGRAAQLTTVAAPGMAGGLRDGIYARSFETAPLGAASDLFTGDQSFTFTANATTQSITIGAGASGVTGAELASQLNQQLAAKNIHAHAAFVDNSGIASIRIDALHDVTDVSAILNDDEAVDFDLRPPDGNITGGLPNAQSGQPFGDAVRSYTLAGSPLSSFPGALDISLVVATPSGNKTVTVSVSASERTNDPDPSPGVWSAAFQDRLDAALNAAGVYVGAGGADLTHWSVGEASGQRIASISINGQALTLSSDAPAYALGGAFSAERSFTSAQAATGLSDDVPALLTDQSVSVSFDTVWGPKTVSASLQPGDPRTLESAALRLNEAFAAQGYDLGVVAASLSGGGAGLRLVSGASHTIVAVKSVSLGGAQTAVSLDAIDAQSRADDPPGALGVAQRAARGAAATLTVPASTTLSAPSSNPTAWFPGRAFDVAIGGGAKVATARALATAADGSVYVLADLSGDSANAAIKGASDVALFKYDSAGKLAFTRMLGAANKASGFALAVGADGKVAVAGSIEVDLSGTAASRGGSDGFVTVYDKDGGELWTARRGGAGNDEVAAVSFASNGSVVVAGKTDSALGAQLALGGADGYVRGFSAQGAELFTRQFGTGRDDAASALLVRDNGAGGFDIFTGGVEDNRGVVRAFTYSPGAGLASGATRDLGYFYKGSISALAADGASLYVGGGVGADRLSVANVARGAVAGQDGFVARIDADLVSSGLDRVSYIGSAQDDAVKGISLVNGAVYAAGVSGGVLAGTGSANAKQGFLTRLDDDGQAAWTRSFTSSGGAVSVQGLAVDASGASPLDVLGLPRGTVTPSDNSPLVGRSALRVDDEFKIGLDGRRATTIKIAKTDTLASLVGSINRALGASGRAEIVKADGFERIKITAKDGQAVRIEEGRSGHDALGGLGLSAGVVAVNASSARGALKTFGLGLVSGELKLDSAGAIAKTKNELTAAISIVRQAYEALLHPNAKPQTDAEKALAARKAAAGVSTEFSAQIANYRAALARLGGG